VTPIAVTRATFSENCQPRTLDVTAVLTQSSDGTTVRFSSAA